jgi:hypothetical protein
MASKKNPKRPIRFSSLVQLRVEPSERKAWKRLAEANDRTVSSWLRSLANAAVSANG